MVARTTVHDQCTVIPIMSSLTAVSTIFATMRITPEHDARACLVEVVMPAEAREYRAGRCACVSTTHVGKAEQQGQACAPLCGPTSPARSK